MIAATATRASARATETLSLNPKQNLPPKPEPKMSDPSFWSTPVTRRKCQARRCGAHMFLTSKHAESLQTIFSAGMEGLCTVPADCGGMKISCSRDCYSCLLSSPEKLTLAPRWSMGRTSTYQLPSMLWLLQRMFNISSATV